MPPLPRRCRMRNSPSTCPVQSTSSEAVGGIGGVIAPDRSGGWIALSIAACSLLTSPQRKQGLDLACAAGLYAILLAPQRFGELNLAARRVGVARVKILAVGRERD